MGTSRNVQKSWGTWYTPEGERADAWTSESRAGTATRAREALVSSSVHGLGGSGPGLSGFVDVGLGLSTKLGSLL